METNVPGASHLVYVASRFVPVAPPISRAVGHLLDAVFPFHVERVPLFPFFLRTVLFFPSPDCRRRLREKKN